MRTPYHPDPYQPSTQRRRTSPEMGNEDLAVFWIASVAAVLAVVLVVALKMSGPEVRVALQRGAAAASDFIAQTVVPVSAATLVVQSKSGATATR
jgi:hypothetical protein